MKSWFVMLRSTSGRVGFNVFLAALLALVVLVSLRFGALKLTYAEILETFWLQPEGVDWQILWNIRLPRILLGVLVGGSLAVSGAILQGIMSVDWKSRLEAAGHVCSCVLHGLGEIPAVAEYYAEL